MALPVSQAHALTNFEIIENMNKFPKVNNFQGVYMRNELNFKLARNGSYVINTDTDNKSGAHWIAIINKPNLNRVIYYDSLGSPPNLAFIKFMRTSYKKIMYNSSPIQGAGSLTCGYYVIYCIRQIDLGVSFYNMLYQFIQAPTIFNENFISKIL